jgi:FdhD protein
MPGTLKEAFVTVRPGPDIPQGYHMLEKIPIFRVTGTTGREDQDPVVIEIRLSIVLNGRELVTLLCSPEKPEFLAAGFLCSEGLIAAKEDIREITFDEEKGLVAVATREPRRIAGNILSRPLIGSSGGKGAVPDAELRQAVENHSRITLSSRRVFELMDDFAQRSHVFKITGGVHSAALCTSQEIILFSEDIGRHNAIDKIFGECLLRDIPLEDRIFLTSGRVSSEIVLKVARRNIPILISKSAPTTIGVKLAREMGITLIGFVRGRKMNIYSHVWRITYED